MLKDIRRKVMQIANRLVGRGYIRANAMATAWKLIRYRALRTKVSGTSFDNRQNVLQLLCKYNPARISVKLVRDRLNAFDSNAIAITAAVKGKVSAVNRLFAESRSVRYSRPYGQGNFSSCRYAFNRWRYE